LMKPYEVGLRPTVKELQGHDSRSGIPESAS
jgi:hypothetical protein